MGTFYYIRTILSPDAIDPSMKEEMRSFQIDIVLEVSNAVAENRVDVVGIRYNPAVNKARDVLEILGNKFHLSGIRQLHVQVA